MVQCVIVVAVRSEVGFGYNIHLCAWLFKSNFAFQCLGEDAASMIAPSSLSLEQHRV